METEKQVFDRQMFAGWAEMVGHREGFYQTLLVPPSPPLVHAVVVCGDGPRPRTGPLSTLFRQLEGRSQSKTMLRLKRPKLGWQILLPCSRILVFLI